MMNPHVFIARRHLKSRHAFNFISFISYLSIIGLGIGVTVLILTLAVLNGFENEVQRKIVSFDGHLRLKGLLGRPLPESNDYVDSVLTAIPGILDRAPYVRNAAMIRYKKRTEGVLIEGIWEDKVRSVLGISGMIESGEFSYISDQEGDEGIVIGRDLANNLGLSLSDKVTLFDLKAMATPGLPPRLKRFYISGIFSTGLHEYDDTMIYMNLASAQELFGLPNQITGEIIKTITADRADNISSLLNESVVYPYSSSTWKERHFNLFSWLNIQKYPITIIFALIVLVAIVNVASSLIMIVMEKTRDIGVLRTVGFTQKDISRIFISEGAIIGIVGVLLGFLLTCAVGFVQLKWGVLRIPEEIYFMQELPILFKSDYFITVGLVGIALALLATLYPAWKASRLQPAEVLRYE